MGGHDKKVGVTGDREIKTAPKTNLQRRIILFDAEKWLQSNDLLFRKPGDA